VFIGEIKADGQFSVVWKTKGPVIADPWSDYIVENKGKANVPMSK
jgi:urea transport system substrate-binding protein